MHFYELASAITEHHSCFSLLIKAVTKDYLGSRQEAYVSPLDGEDCQKSHWKTSKWGTKCAFAVIFGKHHWTRPSRSILYLPYCFFWRQLTYTDYIKWCPYFLSFPWVPPIRKSEGGRTVSSWYLFIKVHPCTVVLLWLCQEPKTDFKTTPPTLI